MMSLLTLGYSSARDGIYEQAAKGLYEKPSILIMLMIPAALIGAPIITYLAARMAMKRISEERKDKRTSEEIKSEMERKMRRLFWLTTGSVCLSTVLGVQLFFMGYSNAVVGRFNQELAIITPDITEQQRQIFQARFASMKTRTEFVSMFEEINKIAEAHGKHKSNFIPW